jgi:RNA recognition motif-containing protein
MTDPVLTPDPAEIPEPVEMPEPGEIPGPVIMPDPMVYPELVVDCDPSIQTSSMESDTAVSAEVVALSDSNLLLDSTDNIISTSQVELEAKDTAVKRRNNNFDKALSLVLKDFPKTWDEAAIHNFLSEKLGVDSFNYIRPVPTTNATAIKLCFVGFNDKASMEVACNSLNGTLIEDKPISASPAKLKERKPSAHNYMLTSSELTKNNNLDNKHGRRNFPPRGFDMRIPYFNPYDNPYAHNNPYGNPFMNPYGTPYSNPYQQTAPYPPNQGNMGYPYSNRPSMPNMGSQYQGDFPPRQSQYQQYPSQQQPQFAPQRQQTYPAGQEYPMNFQPHLAPQFPPGPQRPRLTPLGPPQILSYGVYLGNLPPYVDKNTIRQFLKQNNLANQQFSIRLPVTVDCKYPSSSFTSSPFILISNMCYL